MRNPLGSTKIGRSKSSVGLGISFGDVVEIAIAKQPKDHDVIALYNLKVQHVFSLWSTSSLSLMDHFW
jgi:hypothetical protein